MFFGICILLTEIKGYIREEQENSNTKENNLTNTINIVSNETNNTKSKNNTIQKNISTNKSTTKNNTKNQIKQWKVVIPKINLNAPIEEGTTNEVMDKSVGHFEQTSKLNGNIGLAAHNRGYPVNYFQNIKKLVKGDKIQYFYGDVVKEYKVETITIISDTDWTYLNKTNDNRITLITCVEDEPNYRRCIQAIEVK